MDRKDIENAMRQLADARKQLAPLLQKEREYVASYIRAFLAGCKNKSFSLDELKHQEDSDEWTVWHDVYDRHGGCTYRGYIERIEDDGEGLTALESIKISASDDFGYGIVNVDMLKYLPHDEVETLYCVVKNVEDLAEKGEITFREGERYTYAEYVDTDEG